MSKRQEVRLRRKREKMRNRITVILLVAAGALLVGFAFIMPMIRKTQEAANVSKTPVIAITPEPVNALADGVHFGDPAAPVKVDVFADFRCSACKVYVENFEMDIIRNYVETGKVYYSFYTYLVIDNYDNTDASYRSASAAMCAAEQGRFWDYHTTLFANQVTEEAALFTNERLIKMAENLKLDITRFNGCFDSNRYANEINADINKAISLKIDRTPSILVNGFLVDSFSQVAETIDAALAGQ